MRTTAIFNLKGGVAKSTTVINMAAILAKKYGKKILIRDIITPNQAPAKIGTERDGELIPFADQDPKVRIFQDERYFVEMTEVNDEVCLYIFKKN